MYRMPLCLLVALMMVLFAGDPASAQWIKLPKTKNTPFDPGTWNPIPKGKKDNSNVSGLAVMTPARIADDGKVIGPKSNTAQTSEVIGQATLVYEGKQAYWSWTGPTMVGGRDVKELRRRAPQHDQPELLTDNGGIINLPQPSPPPNPPVAGLISNPKPFGDSSSTQSPNNKGQVVPQQQKNAWFELGRSIRRVIEEEAQRNQ